MCFYDIKEYEDGSMDTTFDGLLPVCPSGPDVFKETCKHHIVLLDFFSKEAKDS